NRDEMADAGHWRAYAGAGRHLWQAGKVRRLENLDKRGRNAFRSIVGHQRRDVPYRAILVQHSRALSAGSSKTKQFQNLVSSNEESALIKSTPVRRPCCTSLRRGTGSGRLYSR